MKCNVMGHTWVTEDGIFLASSVLKDHHSKYTGCVICDIITLIGVNENNN